MRKLNENKMPGVNSRFASVSESIFNGFLQKMLLRSLPVYILKQLFFSISVNSGRIFTSPLRGSVNILPLFTINYCSALNFPVLVCPKTENDKNLFIKVSNRYGALRCFVFSIVSSSDDLHLYMYKQFYMSTGDF